MHRKIYLHTREIGCHFLPSLNFGLVQSTIQPKLFLLMGMKNRIKALHEHRVFVLSLFLFCTSNTNFRNIISKSKSQYFVACFKIFLFWVLYIVLYVIRMPLRTNSLNELDDIGFTYKIIFIQIYKREYVRSIKLFVFF